MDFWISICKQKTGTGEARERHNLPHATPNPVCCLSQDIAVDSTLLVCKANLKVLGGKKKVIVQYSRILPI